MLTPIKPLQLELTPGQKKLLAVCRQHSSVPRAKIVEKTGLRSGSVTSISKELLAMNMIKEGPREKVGRGQPIIPLQLNPYAAFSFGIAFHIHRIEVALANFCGEVIDTETIDYAEDAPIIDVLKNIKAQIDVLVDKHKIQNARILGIGVSMPGPSEGDGKSIRTIIQMGHWRGVDLASIFGDVFEWPVWIDNDCNVAVVGEFYSGQWPEVKNMVLFELGHGVGGGVIINRKLYRGSRHNAGEIGTYFNLLGEENKPTIRGLLDQLAASGLEVDGPEDIPGLDNPVVSKWVRFAAAQLKPMLVVTLGWVDPDCIVIGGSCPQHISQAIIDEVALDKVWEEAERSYAMAQFSPSKIGSSLNTYGACMFPVFRTLGI